MPGGPVLSRQIIDTAEQIRVMGVVFHPGGTHALTGEDATRLIGRDIGLPDLFGRGANLLREQLLETGSGSGRLRVLVQWLRQRMRTTAPDPAVSHALDPLARLPQVQQISRLARDAGVSERRLGLLFQRQVGMRPKYFARIARFRAVVMEAQRQASVNWSHVAADGGYCDQAHLAHELRTFAGVTPSVFMAARGGRTRIICRWIERQKSTRLCAVPSI